MSAAQPLVRFIGGGNMASALIGGLMALLEPAINTVAFYFHERTWTRWGRRGGDAPQDAGAAPAGFGTCPVC